ncbi:copper homeostasis protein CutC [Thalassotalea sp. 1_MG-2023]|uniref:copper homeostasis protein CutC n=1 Tax=Thalassotalea sp. 1_MG-2023 TaxID=3062680 RepID=UPI0026E41128|nr:copper homeostasis protein CutC [Thalassotalea sp. 1_MG-2023]MDO6428053.1 copper homeostasis protein CutC [Thalassotalea sp. 1_MG-2023]
MNSIEVCLDADNLTVLAQNAKICNKAGVDRIELCADMHVDGLTPSFEAIRITRQNFPSGELMVMIRPRAGDFNYFVDELITMNEQIIQAKECGADGVVFGVVDHQQQINLNACQMLLYTTKKLSLKTTFHRAFDAILERETALAQLKDLAFDRVLTSGVAWKTKGNALDGINNINRYLSLAGEHIEVVIAGGVSANNISAITRQLSLGNARVSFHSYSGVLNNDLIDALAIKHLQH